MADASAVDSHLGQLAPLVLIEKIAHVRGGCTPGSSRLGVLVPSGDRLGPTEPAALTALVHIEPLAHVRGGGVLSPQAFEGPPQTKGHPAKPWVSFFFHSLAAALLHFHGPAEGVLHLAGLNGR